MANLPRCSFRRRRSVRRERRAFTLIELLVVISIILLLAALIMPMLGRASRQARGAQCVSNLRQLGDAFRMYANTFKGRLPGTYGCGTPTWLMNPDPHTNHPLAWENSPHKGQLFPFYQDADLVKCPADGEGNGKFSYGTPINIRYRLIQNAEAPVRTPLVLDEHERYCIGCYVGPNASPPRRERSSTSGSLPRKRATPSCRATHRARRPTTSTSSPGATPADRTGRRRPPLPVSARGAVAGGSASRYNAAVAGA